MKKESVHLEPGHLGLCTTDIFPRDAIYTAHFATNIHFGGWDTTFDYIICLKILFSHLTDRAKFL